MMTIDLYIRLKSCDKLKIMQVYFYWVVAAVSCDLFFWRASCKQKFSDRSW